MFVLLKKRITLCALVGYLNWTLTHCDLGTNFAHAFQVTCLMNFGAKQASYVITIDAHIGAKQWGALPLEWKILHSILRKGFHPSKETLEIQSRINNNPARNRRGALVLTPLPHSDCDVSGVRSERQLQKNEAEFQKSLKKVDAFSTSQKWTPLSATEVV